MTNESRNTLKLADGFAASSIQELCEHFDLISVLEHYTSGKLLEWLNELQLVEEAQAVASMNP